MYTDTADIPEYIIVHNGLSCCIKTTANLATSLKIFSLGVPITTLLIQVKDQSHVEKSSQGHIQIFYAHHGWFLLFASLL